MEAKLGDYLRKIERVAVKRDPKAPNSHRAEQCLEILKLMCENVPSEEEKREQRTHGTGKAKYQKRMQVRLRYWLGRTRRLQPYDIEGLLKQARGGNNPAKLFNWLLKQKNAKLQRQKGGDVQVPKREGTGPRAQKQGPRVHEAAPF